MIKDYAAEHLAEAEAALSRLRKANDEYFAVLRKAVGKKAAKKFEEHQSQIMGKAIAALQVLSEPFGLVNDLGQVAVRGNHGEFEGWDTIGTLSGDDKQKRPPPAWAKDYYDR